MIRMFLRLPDPDLLVKGADPDVDPSIIKQNYLEKPLFLLFCDFIMTLKNDVRGVLGNKCAGQSNLKTVQVREIMWK